MTEWEVSRGAPVTKAGLERQRMASKRGALDKGDPRTQKGKIREDETRPKG